MEGNEVFTVFYVLLENGKWVIRSAKLIRKDGRLVRLVTHFGTIEPKPGDCGLTNTFHLVTKFQSRLYGCFVETKYLALVNGVVVQSFPGYHQIEVTGHATKYGRELEGTYALKLPEASDLFPIECAGLMN